MLLVAMMAIGMCVTAFAANDSMNYDNQGNQGNQGPSVEYKADYAKHYYSSKATVAAGAGTISEITDKEILAKAYDQEDAVWAYTDEIDKQLKDGVESYPVKEFLFDVSGVTSGQVTVKLENVSNYINHLAVVSHYNTTTGTWEIMQNLAKIDAQGCITMNFNSYSPIMVSVLNITDADLKDGATIGVQETTYTPQQVAATSPKMGEE